MVARSHLRRWAGLSRWVTLKTRLGLCVLCRAYRWFAARGLFCLNTSRRGDSARTWFTSRFNTATPRGFTFAGLNKRRGFAHATFYEQT